MDSSISDTHSTVHPLSHQAEGGALITIIVIFTEITISEKETQSNSCSIVIPKKDVEKEQILKCYCTKIVIKVQRMFLLCRMHPSMMRCLSEQKLGKNGKS